MIKLTFFAHSKMPQIIFEPGRCITGNAGVLIHELFELKITESKNLPY